MNADEIIKQIRESVTNDIPLDPGAWLDYAVKLNLFLSEEHNTLFTLKQNIAMLKGVLIGEQGNSVAKAEVLVEATDTFKTYKMQEAKIQVIEEFIRLAKSQAKLKGEELKSYGLH